MAKTADEAMRIVWSSAEDTVAADLVTKAHETRVRYLLHRLAMHKDSFTASEDAGRVEELAYVLLAEIKRSEDGWTRING